MDRLFGLDRVSPHSEDMALAETVYNNVRLAIVRSILDGEKIPYVIKYRGSNAIPVIIGQPSYGADVFVEKERLEEALEALAPFEAADGEDEAAEAEEDENN